tara:strand:+ start:3108 stop:3290 length:183 start_codon:yes stop_codon:yes gene_type:complete
MSEGQTYYEILVEVEHAKEVCSNMSNHNDWNPDAIRRAVDDYIFKLKKKTIREGGEWQQL